MRIRRGPLFWGLLLIPLGAIPLLARADYLDTSRFDDVWRFWPLILIGLGIALLLGRGRGSVIGTVIVALIIGTLGGLALAGGSFGFRGITDCAPIDPDGLTTESIEGAFEGPASISLTLECGSIDLATTEDGSGAWSLESRYRDTPPTLTATGSSLDLRVPDDADSRRQEWTLQVEPGSIRDLIVSANAGATSLELSGADIDRVDIDVNAGDLRLDGTDATIRRLDVSMNAGRARITLAGAAEGSISANAGGIDLCVPPDAALRLTVEEQLAFGNNLEDRGLDRDGDTWTRGGDGGSVIALDLEGNAANLTLDPDGGC